MKNKLLMALLVVALLVVPNVAYAASDYFETSDLVGRKEALRDSTAGSQAVSLKKGNITVTKTASDDSKLVIFRFTEVGGFTENTYKSLINILKVIVADEYVSYFQGQYPNMDAGNKSFSHFKVTKTDNLFEVQVCISEMEGPTPTPTPTPTPSATPTPTPSATPIPSSTPTPTPTPTPDVENPSTGDMNTIAVVAIVAVAVCGIGFSLKKINE